MGEFVRRFLGGLTALKVAEAVASLIRAVTAPFFSFQLSRSSIGSFKTLRQNTASLRSSINRGGRGRAPSTSLQLESLERRELLTALAVNISDPTCGEAGDNLYCQIQEAVDAAKERDNILVHAGSYEPTSIDKDDLSIQAVGAGDVVIDASGVDDGVTLDANGVTLRGINVENAGRYGFSVTGDANTLQGNLAQDNDVAGFSLRGAHHNTLSNNTSVGEGILGFQIDLDDARLPSNFNTLSGNTVNGANRGFNIGGSEFNVLRGNVAENTRYSGFSLFGADSNTLQGNIARDNLGETAGGPGGFVLLFGSDSNTLRGNRSENNVGSGFLVAIGGEFNTLQGNTSVGNTDGFVLYGNANSNELQGNQARENKSAGFLITGSSSNTLTGNTAHENGTHGFQVENTSESNVLENNSSLKNAEYGIHVDAILADANEFTNNNCQLNGLGDSNIDGLC